MKKWNRDWKIELIEKENPTCEDLVYKIILNKQKQDSRCHGK